MDAASRITDAALLACIMVLLLDWKIEDRTFAGRSPGGFPVTYLSYRLRCAIASDADHSLKNPLPRGSRIMRSFFRIYLPHLPAGQGTGDLLAKVIQVTSRSASGHSH